VYFWSQSGTDFPFEQAVETPSHGVIAAPHRVRGGNDQRWNTNEMIGLDVV
jgi:hypothetical protein